MTGEIAEVAAAELLGLTLAPALTKGYDALRFLPDGTYQRVRIKARAMGAKPSPGQRMGRLKPGASCDVVLLVILDMDLWRRVRSGKLPMQPRSIGLPSPALGPATNAVHWACQPLRPLPGKFGQPNKSPPCMVRLIECRSQAHF